MPYQALYQQYYIEKEVGSVFKIREPENAECTRIIFEGP